MIATRTTFRAKLIFPSLLMWIFRAKGIPIPQDLSLMPTPLGAEQVPWYIFRAKGIPAKYGFRVIYMKKGLNKKKVI